jgi:hypothetical protein
MSFAVGAKNTMLDALTPTHLSLHDADPGTDGSNEITGGSYARVAATFAAGSGGSRVANAGYEFDVPAGADVTHGAVWDSSTYLGSFDVTDESYTGAGKFTVTSATLTI